MAAPWLGLRPARVPTTPGWLAALPLLAKRGILSPTLCRCV